MSIGSAVFLKDSFKLEEVDKSNTISVDVVSSVGRNILLNSGVSVTNSNYILATYYFAKQPIGGKTYTLVVKGRISESHNGWYLNIRNEHRDNPNIVNLGGVDYLGNGIWKKVFVMPNHEEYELLRIYSNPLGLGVQSTVEWIALYEGDSDVRDWTPAPEDITENDTHPLIDKINLLLSEPLRSAGDVHDRLFRDSDGLWKVERKVISYEVDENNVRMQSMGDDFIRFNLNPPINSTDSRLSDGFSSTHLPYSRYMDGTPEINNGGGNPTIFVWLKKSSLPTPDLEGFKNWISSQRNNGTPFVIQYEIGNYTTETLDQELQDKLNSLRSFQDSNYVYTIVNGTTDIIAENLKPTLHATFKGGGWYERFKMGQEFERQQEAIDEKASQKETDEINDKISTLVPVDDYDDDIGEITTSLKDYKAMIEANEVATGDAIDGISNLVTRTDALTENLGEFSRSWAFLDTKITMGNEGLLVGEYEFDGADPDEPILTNGILIGTDRIDFVSNKVSVAHITGQLMQIDHGIFVDTLTVGEHKIETISGGHTIWQWVE